MAPALPRRPLRIGVRTALVAFVLGGFALTAGAVEGVWWWTAQSNARMLAGALNRQATAQVKEDVAALISGAEATYVAIATTLSRAVIDVGEEDKREVVFLAQLQGRPTPFGSPSGDLTGHSTRSTRSGRTVSTPSMSRRDRCPARNASTPTGWSAWLRYRANPFIRRPTT